MIGPTLSPDELRTLFLFESLSDAQLATLAALGEVRQYPAGAVVCAEGEPAEHFVVLLSGTLTLSSRVRQDDVEVVRTDQRGSYAGATQAYVRDAADRSYPLTCRAVTDCAFLVLPAVPFGAAIREWFPMAIHLLEGLFLGMRNVQAVVGERERLSALGSLTAGLMHELNNPAAAAVRATGTLRQRVAGMRTKLGKIADGRVDREQLRALTQLQESIIERAAKAPRLTAMQTSDREDELGDWLEERGATAAWDLAAVFAQSGLDLGCLDEVQASVAPDLLDQALHWLGYALETEQLMTDIEDATARISNLVAAAKQYSQLDRASYQRIDVRDGLDSTLVMLTHKIGDAVTVVREYEPDLPRIPAHAGELNQVWTNLIDNAVHAMRETGGGTLTVRTAREGDRVLVEVRDTGPGVPEEIRHRVFEPFFTTKAVGEGTGLGLDISYRIVVNRHGGQLTVESVPGDTRFQVRLPLTEPPSV
jgi:signal transduction histidine kinase